MLNESSFQEISDTNSGNIKGKTSPSPSNATDIKSANQIIDLMEDQDDQDDNNNDTRRIKRGQCDDCGEKDLYLDGILLEHFKVNVCFTCKQESFESKDKKYAFLSKSQAKRDFLLPDSYFDHLPCLLRQNPHHESFAPLKLYLKKHILEEAIDLHGSMEDLHQEKEKRRTVEYTKAAQRTKHLLGRRRLEEENDCKKKKKKKMQQQQKYISVAEKDHRHIFEKEYPDPTNTTADSSTAWIKECHCGMKVAFEKW